MVEMLPDPATAVLFSLIFKDKECLALTPQMPLSPTSPCSSTAARHTDSRATVPLVVFDEAHGHVVVAAV